MDSLRDSLIKMKEPKLEHKLESPPNINSPSQNPAPTQQIPSAPKTPPTSPEKPLNTQIPVLTSLSPQNLQKALQPDLQSQGIQVTYINAAYQEVN